MEKRFLLKEKGLEIPCILSVPENGDIRRLVLGVHGLCGSAMDEIQSAIAEEMGLFHAVTLRFDFPAHGESPIKSEGFTLENCKKTLLAAAECLKEHFPEIEDLCLFATGFGAYMAFVCLEDLMELPGKIKLVVQTPSVRMHEALLSMSGMNLLTYQALGKVIFRTRPPLEVGYHFYQDMLENVALARYAIPFLILQGEKDDFINMEDIHNLRRINEKAKLVVIPGASHRFQEEGAWDMVLDLTRDWFEFEQVVLCDWE